MSNSWHRELRARVGRGLSLAQRSTNTVLKRLRPRTTELDNPAEAPRTRETPPEGVRRASGQDRPPVPPAEPPCRLGRDELHRILHQMLSNRGKMDLDSLVAAIRNMANVTPSADLRAEALDVMQGSNEFERVDWAVYRARAKSDDRTVLAARAEADRCESALREAANQVLHSRTKAHWVARYCDAPWSSETQSRHPEAAQRVTESRTTFCTLWKADVLPDRDQSQHRLDCDNTKRLGRLLILREAQRCLSTHDLPAIRQYLESHQASVLECIEHAVLEGQAMLDATDVELRAAVAELKAQLAEAFDEVARPVRDQLLVPDDEHLALLIDAGEAPVLSTAQRSQLAEARDVLISARHAYLERLWCDPLIVDRLRERIRRYVDTETKRELSVWNQALERLHELERAATRPPAPPKSPPPKPTPTRPRPRPSPKPEKPKPTSPDPARPSTGPMRPMAQHLCLGKYHPYWLPGRVRNPRFDDYSGMILDLKKEAGDCRREQAEQRFVKQLAGVVPSGVMLAYVPSSRPANSNTGVRAIARRLAGGQERDATGCLVRTREIKPAHEGGERTRKVHYDSIEVRNSHLVRGKHVAVLDDVRTTGTSLSVCAAKLIEAGAHAVTTVALGQTTHDH